MLEVGEMTGKTASPTGSRYQRDLQVKLRRHDGTIMVETGWSHQTDGSEGRQGGIEAKKYL